MTDVEIEEMSERMRAAGREMALRHKERVDRAFIAEMLEPIRKHAAEIADIFAEAGKAKTAEEIEAILWNNLAIFYGIDAKLIEECRQAPADAPLVVERTPQCSLSKIPPG